MLACDIDMKMGSLRFMIGVLSAFLLSASSHKCRKRVEVRDMTPQQLEDLIEAIHYLKKNVSSSRYRGYSKWDEWARIYSESVDSIHSRPFFFPWNRQFLWEVESEMQKYKPNITIPYWDWAYDAARPADSIVLREDWFGPPGNRCVKKGKFANWKVKFPRDGCLERDVDPTRTWNTRAELHMIINQSKTYHALFDGMSPIPFGTTHLTIGGNMAKPSAPNDPLFYFHHSFLDKLYDEWQWQADNDYPFHKNATLLHLSGKVSDSLNPTSETFCIHYVEPKVWAPRSVGFELV
jgi:hypothetical protein